jgi:hypothetical protein
MSSLRLAAELLRRWVAAAIAPAAAGRMLSGAAKAAAVLECSTCPPEHRRTDILFAPVDGLEVEHGIYNHYQPLMANGGLLAGELFWKRNWARL